MGSALLHNTYSTYDTGWRSWLRYCRARRLHPLRGTSADVCDYLVELARKGTVSIRSCQPYLSAINRAYADCGRRRPAKGHYVNAIRNALRLRQRGLHARARRVPLPAEVGKRLHDATVALVGSPDWPRSQPELHLGRDLLQAIISVLSGSRPSSIRTLDVAGLQVTAGGIRLRRAYVKGQIDAEPYDIVGRVDVTFRGFVNLERALTRYLDVVCAGAAPTDLVFQLGPCDGSSEASARWWRSALAHVRAVAPAGCAYLPHSARATFASGTHVVVGDRDKLEYVGGWAPGSPTVGKHYIDPLFPHTPAAVFLYGWMRQGLAAPSAAPPAVYNGQHETPSR